MRVAADGSLLDTHAINLASGDYLAGVETFALGNDVGLLWADCCGILGPRPLFGGRLSQDGVALDPVGLVLSSAAPIDTFYAGVAQGAGARLFYRAPAAANAWISRTLWHVPTSAALVPGTAAWLDPMPAPQGNIEYVSGDPVGLVVFSDRRDGDARLYVGRVDSNGTPIDGAGSVISPSPDQQQEVDGGTAIRGPRGVARDSGVSLPAPGGLDRRHGHIARSRLFRSREREQRPRGPPTRVVRRSSILRDVDRHARGHCAGGGRAAVGDGRHAQPDAASLDLRVGRNALAAGTRAVPGRIRNCVSR
jgi:hypothetical protein